MRLAALKLLLISGSLLIGGAQISSRAISFIQPEIQWINLIAFAGLWLVCLTGILAAAFNKLAGVRWPLALIFAICGWLVSGYELTVSDHMTYSAFIDMTDAAASLGDAWNQHSQTILIAALQAALMLFGVGLSHGVRTRFNGALSVLIPVAAIAIFTAMLFVRGGEGGKGLPPSFNGTGYSALYLYEEATTENTPRQKVSIKQTGDAGKGDIILIVDESIAGQYLDINNPQGVRSGLKEARAGVAVHNFGLAAAISHCSAAVNYTLRHGGTRESYQQINRNMPSIWSYAKKAGYQTVYVDAQRTGRAFDNLMDADELKDIDKWQQFDDVPVQMRDHAATDALAGYLNDDKRQFIYVNKVGAHFPIHDKFPDSHMKYMPVLPRGAHKGISDTGDRSGFSGKAESWPRYRNSYRNTLLWNVGAFFDRLLAKSTLNDATIIYTADHGQNLYERGQDGVTTHCAPNPVPEEGVVPLVVLGTDGQRDWQKAAEGGFNQSSHYRIFPTLLAMMGYDASAIEAQYGEDLFSTKPDPFTFNYLFNARLGQEPLWKKIDVAEVTSPPASDFSNRESKRAPKAP